MSMDREKFKALVHLICFKCKDNPSILGATKLNKVAWFSEVNYYVKTGKEFTGVRFTKQAQGPVAAPMTPIIEELVADGVLTVKDVPFHSYSKKEYVTLNAPDTSMFSASDLEMIDRTIKRVCYDNTALFISGVTHTPAWEVAELGETLPLYSVLATPGVITDEHRAWADSQIALRK